MHTHDIAAAIQALKRGDLIVYPTDTLYALGADIFDAPAVQRVFEVKHRPFTIPLPVAVADVHMMETLAFMDTNIRKVAHRFLPGPLTLILRKKRNVAPLVTGGKDTIAIRIPDNDIALALLSDVGPLTVTSANVHGEKTPDVIKTIQMQFDRTSIAVYLDYGRLVGKPSTIVDMTSQIPKILRQGAISEHEILDAISHE